MVWKPSTICAIYQSFYIAAVASLGEKRIDEDAKDQSSRDDYRALCRNWGGRTIRIAAIPTFPPFFIMSRSIGGGWIPEEGVELKLIETLAEALNFNFLVLVPADMEMGTKRENGSWSGMMGMLLLNEADLGVSLIAISYERYKIADFSVPYISEPVTFFTRAPAAKSKEFVVVRPFSQTVWMCVITSLMIASFFLYVMGRVEDQLQKTSGFSLYDITWYLLGSLASKGVPNCFFKSSVTRPFMAAWLIFVAVLIFSYSGTLLSFLVVPELELPIASVEQLDHEVTHRGFSCGAVDKTSVFKNLKEAEAGILGNIGRMMRSNRKNVAPDAQLGLQRALKMNYALILPRLLGEITAIPLGREKFYTPPDKFYSIDLAIAMQKKFRCGHILSETVIRILEAGLMNKWIEDSLEMLRRSAAAKSPSGNENKALAVDDLQGAFYILPLGYCTAAGCLLLEKLYAGKCRKKRRKRRK